MGVSHRKNFSTTLFIFSIVLVSRQELVAAMRPLGGAMDKENRRPGVSVSTAGASAPYKW